MSRLPVLPRSDLRIAELELVPDVDVVVALVLELLDEAVCFFLRYPVGFQRPALHNLEDL